LAKRERSDWIAGRIASARADAERIAAELVHAGRLTASEASAIAGAVDQAIERGRALLGDALDEPRRMFASLRSEWMSSASHDAAGAAATSDASAPSAAASARIAALEARVAALEAALGAVLAATRGARHGDGGHGDG
jgi:polyhydroxyalkanoate synthesis regulator phasin